MPFRVFPFRFPARLRAAVLPAPVSALVAAPCAADPVALPASPAEWRAAAPADIDAAVRITRANHPGMQDRHNPGFSNKLEAARRHGLALANEVRDLAWSNVTLLKTVEAGLARRQPR